MQELLEKISELIAQDDQAALEDLIAEFSSQAIEHADFEAVFNLASYLQSIGFVYQALSLCDAVLERADIEEFRLLKAEILLDDNQVDLALDLLLAIDEDSDLYLSALMIMADAYVLYDLPDVALHKLKIAKRLAPKERAIDYALYQLYYLMGENQEALNALELVGESDLLSPEDYQKQMGRLLSSLGQYEEAVDLLEKLPMEEQDSSSLFELGLAYYQLEDYPRAIQWLKELLVRDPDFMSAYYYLGDALISNHQEEEGLALLEEALANNPYQEALYLRLLDYYHSHHKHGKEEELFEMARANHVESPTLQVRYAQFLMHMEDYQGVVDYISDLAQEQSLDNDLSWILASAYAALEEDEQASEWYQYAYDLFKEDADFVEEYALYAREIGRRDLFNHLMTQLAQLDPMAYQALKENL